MAERITSALTLGRRCLRFVCCALVLSAGVFSWPTLPSNASEPFSSPSSQAKPDTQREQDVRSLELGKPVERELAGGQSHSYRVTLAAGQYLNVVVDQHSIDVLVTLFSPDGKQISEADNPNGAQGVEIVALIAEAPGSYRVEVRTVESKAGAGRYEIKVVALRQATGQDQNWMAAERLSKEAEGLRNQRKAEALRKAIEKYREALPLWQAAGDRRMEAEAIFNLGQIVAALGDVRKALEHFNQALPLYQAAGDRLGEAFTRNEVGLAYYTMGERQKALESYQQALQIHRDLSNPRGETAPLINIGQVYYSMADPAKAIECYRQALPVCQTTGDRENEAGALNNIGQAYDAMEEKQKAIEYYQQARLLIRALGNQRGEAVTLNNLGYVYSSLGDYQNALAYYEQSLPLRQATGDQRGEARTLNNIGYVYSVMGQSQKALEHIGQALKLSRKLEDKSLEANTLNNFAGVHNMLGQYQQALEYCLQSLPLSRAVGYRLVEGSTLHNIGRIYEALGEPEKALEHYQQSLTVLRAIGARRWEALVLTSLARVERARGHLGEAHALITESLGLTEATRAKVASLELRSTLFASVQDRYGFDIDLLMQLHQQDPTAGRDGEALQASERARARSLLELLSESHADIRQGIDPALLERERALQQQLNAKAAAQLALLNRKHTEAQAAAAAKEIAATTAQYQELGSQIRASSPRYAALTQPQPLSAPEIQQGLDADTMLLEYALGSEHSYLWAVTPNAITSHQLPPRTELEASAMRVRDLLLARRDETDAEYRMQAEGLSRMLLGPVAAQLGTKRLVIVASGALQYLPFAALPAPGSQQPLIVEHEIVNLPSASVLAVLRRETAGRQPAAKAIAVLADPVFGRSDPRVRAGGKTVAPSGSRGDASPELPPELERATRDLSAGSDPRPLSRLPFSRQEAGAIATAAPKGPVMTALDFQASRATATSGELGQYRIIHFATHGLLDAEHPELSGLVFSLVDRNGNPQDGYLRLHEIFNLRLPADLVVLSACRTGLGKEVKGEGLIGLTRGFMYAGAPRVVASLWQVDDVATAELMKHFYRGMLRDGLPAAAALRAAQIEMGKRKQWQAPFYWGAFVLQGEWR